MLRAEGHIIPAQNDRYAGIGTLDNGDGVEEAGIPVCHHGCDHDEIRSGDRLQCVLENAGGHTITVEIPGNRFQRRRLRDSFRCVGSLSGRFSFGHGDMMLMAHGRIIRIKTIDKCDMDSMDPEQGRQGKKPQRLVPEIICGKIIDPGVDEEDVAIHVEKVTHLCPRDNISNKLT